MNAETVAAALGRYERKNGGGFMALCPSHADKNPSLAVDDGGDGLLVKCFAGCPQENVVASLKLAGLWPGSDRAKTSPPPRKSPAPTWRPILPVPEDAPPPPATHHRYGTPSMQWRYRAATGELLHLVCRFDVGGGKQVLPLTFCENSDTGKRVWRWLAIPHNRPLYGLETLGDALNVLIVEGEKACEAARRLTAGKLPILSWSGGSNAINKTNWSPLAGRRVCVWPDADQPGFKAAAKICEVLHDL